MGNWYDACVIFRWIVNVVIVVTVLWGCAAEVRRAVESAAGAGWSAAV